jgi:hypothetical protein
MAAGEAAQHQPCAKGWIHGFPIRAVIAAKNGGRPLRSACTAQNGEAALQTGLRKS